MKKVFLSLALVASLLVVSCKETTQDKVEDATEADAAAEGAVDAIDSTATVAGDAVENAAAEGAAKVEEAAKEVKEEVKK